MSVSEIRKLLRKRGSKERAQHSMRFFKTGPGEYGEGDIFLGLKVPETRAIAKQFPDLPLAQVRQLLRSKIHEERLLALLMLVQQYSCGSKTKQGSIYTFYLKHTNWVNNWDLVDSSADRIVGAHLLGRSRRPLYKLARSKNLWERRIAIVATFAFIREGDFADTLDIAELLRDDDHDLIHKAVGWMLREVGNRDRSVEESFLKQHYEFMPRTMLRYAIERFPERRRQAYLKGRV